MLQAWPKINISAFLVICAGFSLLVALAVQYPLSVTFPMGGDAPSYIKTSQAILSGNLAILINTTSYPLADLSFLPFSLLPLSWPMRYVWWAAASQITVGLTLAWVLKQHFGWPAAAAGLAFWSFMAISASRHFEDGTIAQLLSYAPLFLVISHLLFGQVLKGVLWFIIATLTHPITGVVLVMALLPTFLGWLAVWPLLNQSIRRSLRLLLFIGLPLLPIILYIFYRFYWIALTLTGTPSNSSILSLTESSFWAVFLLAIVGFSFLIKNSKYHTHKIILLISITISFILLAHNNWLGFGIWTDRLYPYLVVWSIFLASYAWPYLLQNFPIQPVLRFALGAMLPLILFSVAWTNNAQIYHRYESPHHYLRLHPEEISAFDWINQHLPPQPVIYTSTVNRHTEWLSILTSAQWIQVIDNKISSPTITEFLPKTDSQQNKFILFLTNREEVPRFFQENSSRYPTIFKNNSATLITLTAYDQTQY